ncbi:methylmalonyl Co-A mutase-associated GTPase MeaB [Sporosarcina trichiuri]|uniref:methylmalonyl Co-A mutase-associated GTPase MeaB n=1 Tax=Sporosarcina trichiuri TaxID=3056445 RepID=UPI0025B56F87|nr:methylmalonyl Co-A mutase-associated GTPase MeaB [Sporosarcina sp. 0.2-SM1T-5]WJY28410.1 methylmalonyl Co-A mutase-associated GTPase MeaB [Sporosarcina sp. 0.2-SM1T-5]
MSSQDNVRGKETALNIAEGVTSSHDGMRRTGRKVFRKSSGPLDIGALTAGISSGDRLSLAKGITLLESTAAKDRPAGQELLLSLLPKTGRSVRVGITGVPGAGKSTFIEAFGLMLTEAGHRVAVLAVDPSSTVSGGSILGDKTRMELLAREPKAFIRPSPSAGTLGGVHRKTRETMLLCEAAGYDVILVETVGVGQSETAVREMTDFFLMLALTGAGDELQGMKKGIMELVDGVLVHKADGGNERLAKKTVRDYRQLAHFLQPATPGWTTQALAVSSIEKTGLAETWAMIESFRDQMQSAGYWTQRRQEQTRSWFHSMIEDQLIHSFYETPGRKELVAALEARVLADELTVAGAVKRVFSEDEGAPEENS